VFQLSNDYQSAQLIWEGAGPYAGYRTPFAFDNTQPLLVCKDLILNENWAETNFTNDL